jgi:hypothetical protein
MDEVVEPKRARGRPRTRPRLDYDKPTPPPPPEAPPKPPKSTKKIETRGGARPGSGAKPLVPDDADRALVAQLASFGLPHDDIRKLIITRRGKPINQNTFTKHFAEELANGRLHANAKVAQSLFRKAISGNPACMIFWLKTRAGWREKMDIEVAGQGGGPMEVKHIGMDGVYAQLGIMAQAAITSNGDSTTP